MSLDKTINDLAYERFQDATAKIEKVQKGIQENRMGEKNLSEIGSDPDKLAKRMARENMPTSIALERINGVPNFQDIQVLKKIFKISEAVCRITIKTRYGSSGYGTGFLVGPGIIMTNNHVFPDADTAKNSTVQFNYELEDTGESKKIQTFNLCPEKLFFTSAYEVKTDDPLSGLDFSIVAVCDKSKEGKNILEIPPVILDETLGKIIEGENCVVIQHPKGDYKKIVMKDIRMITLQDDFLIYESDTLPGSSGAAVIGLGTGEIVALHHSSVPRKNAQGQWLRKDGGVYKDGEPDDSIDWLGNEGIRVSSLLKCIKNAVLSPEMSVIRNTIILSDNQPTTVKAEITATKKVTPTKTQKPMKQSNESVVNQAINILQSSDAIDDNALQYFEVELSPILMMQDDWKEHYLTLVPEIINSEPLFPFSTIASQKSIQYITLKSNENPWELAAKLEALPQVKTATPDLPMETDLQFRSQNNTSVTESDMLESMKTSSAVGRQDDFKTKWNNAEFFDIKEDITEERQRQWNRIAIGMTEQSADEKEISNQKTVKSIGILEILEKIAKEKENHYFELLNDAEKATLTTKKAIDAKKNNLSKEKEAQFIENLKNLNLVQLDTGYTDHAKVKGRFNYDRDEDFIDGSDARDDMISGLLKHPGHGTRTASIILGGKMSSFKKDGNYGILCYNNQKEEENSNYKTLTSIIPYRIAESVVLINRGKNLVDAVNQSIHTNADVMFMCMGSYPRPMIAEAAKAAYDNGVIWVCAAGNEVEMIVAPALYPGTIAVAASNPNQKPWRGSSYGSVVDITAPGEDIYVPSMDEKFNEIMVYGSGTSYATPHVAAAAALWKAVHLEEIDKKYEFPWQIVEAFRTCLKKSANLPSDWDQENYGAGILNIYALLKQELPDSSTLKYAYNNSPKNEWDLGIREGVHFLWQVLLKKMSPRKTIESFSEMMVTERGRIALTAMTGNTVSSIFESDSINSVEDSEKILKMYFDSYKN